MKKFYSLYVLVAIFFAACSPPQVTDISAPTECCAKVTVTLTQSPTDTPIPTATPSNTPEPTPTLSPAEKLDNQLQATGLFPDHTPENPAYTIGTDADGNTVAFNSEGEVIFNGARWNSDLIIGIVEDMLAKTGDCEKRPEITPANWRGSQAWPDFTNPFTDRLEEKGVGIATGGSAEPHFFKSQDGCLGVNYYDNKGNAYIFAWNNLKKIMQYFRLFIPAK